MIRTSYETWRKSVNSRDSQLNPTAALVHDNNLEQLIAEPFPTGGPQMWRYIGIRLIMRRRGHCMAIGNRLSDCHDGNALRETFTGVRHHPSSVQAVPQISKRLGTVDGSARQIGHELGEHQLKNHSKHPP